MGQMTAQFLTPIRLEDIDGGHMALFEPLKFYSVLLGPRVVQVLPGFVTDFASVPRLFQNICPKNGPYDGAAILHDAAYRLALKDRSGAPCLITKAQADRLFREAMEAKGVGKVRRNLMYWAVKLFGHGAFDQAPQGAAR